MRGGRRGGANRFGGYFHWLAAIVFSSVTGSAFAVPGDDSHIQYFEPLHLIAPASPAQQKSSGTRELQFDAYGRRFVVTLEPNDRLSPLLQAQAGSTDLQLFRGHIDGAPGSWARISMTGGQMQGMLWDGAEVYVIEPVTQLRDSLPANAKVDPGTTAIFRLDDVVMTPGSASCGTETISKGTDVYNSMVHELKGTPVIMQAVGATKRLEISALGDILFMNRYGTEARARDEILRRLNNVDGIYSSQLGVEISAPSIDIGDSLSATTSAASLLDELADLRKRSPHLYSRGLTHLFTGRNLDGTTVGIGFINSVCDRQFGASLTEATERSAWTESLIAAHEIGHNFGAPHDGEPSQACADTPTGLFLMSPSINGSDQFSACSLSIMQPKAADASCITALSSADIEVNADLGTARQPIDSTFDYALTIRNAGGLTTADAKAEITLPADLTIQEAFVSGGTCISGAGFIHCELGEIAGGNSAVIQLSLRSSVAASHAIAVNVSAANENNVANNHGEGTISTQPEVDLAVSLQVPSSITAGTAFSAAASAANLSGIDADTVTVTIVLPEGVSASGASFAGGNCTIGSGSITCSLPTLAAGASAAGAATLTASASGNAVLQAQIAGGQIDPVSANDTAVATLSVTGVALTANSTSSGGGGGGGAGPALLTLLLAVLGLKNLQRPPQPVDSAAARLRPLAPCLARLKA